ncbi:MAG: GntR family transcriptional regulator [Spirochaetaceae bacterium]|nr:GntR family transcriptional regulator [Spirochaetaceae bacterium]
MKIVKEPIYQQLITILRQLIESDHYEIGDKFLTENEISSTYEISRNTVNKAVTSLIGEGLLEFKKGLGTFIKFKSSQYDLHSLISFTKMAESIGKIPSTIVLEFTKIKSTEVGKEVRVALQIEEEKDLYFMKRLRLLNNKPSIVEIRYVDAELSPGLKKSDVSLSIIAMWMKKYNLKLAGADQTLSAVLLNEENSLLLHENTGDPAIQRESTGYVEGDKPLWYEKTIFCGKDYVFRFRVDSLNMAQTAKSVFIGN